MPRTPFLALLVLAACADAPPPPQLAQPVFPSRQAIAAGRPMVMRRNDPLGYSGTMAAMASAPNCGQLRPAGSDQPLQLLLAGRAVTPGFNFAPAACPTGDRGPALDRAVQLDDGLYAAGADHECFLPNSGGGHCRAVGR